MDSCHSHLDLILHLLGGKRVLQLLLLLLSVLDFERQLLLSLLQGLESCSLLRGSLGLADLLQLGRHFDVVDLALDLCGLLREILDLSAETLDYLHDLELLEGLVALWLHALEALEHRVVDLAGLLVLQLLDDLPVVLPQLDALAFEGDRELLGLEIGVEGLREVGDSHHSELEGVDLALHFRKLLPALLDGDEELVLVVLDHAGLAEVDEQLVEDQEVLELGGELGCRSLLRGPLLDDAEAQGHLSQELCLQILDELEGQLGELLLVHGHQQFVGLLEELGALGEGQRLLALEQPSELLDYEHDFGLEVLGLNHLAAVLQQLRREELLSDQPIVEGPLDGLGEGSLLLDVLVQLHLDRVLDPREPVGLSA
mmetsp:Transcript_9705/g.16337  ORF Transcript_9705/g.16337 Transcript_9705/m.16337 type:complete len:371 (+) Transcript_9705:344-1456(+)